MKKFLEFKIRDSIIYSLWGVIAVQYVYETIKYTIEGNSPAMVGYMLAFMWFMFWALDTITERRFRKSYQGFLDESFKHTDRALDGWAEAEELNKKLNEELKKYRPDALQTEQVGKDN